ncbi:AAA family ATPase [Helicobacter sp. MIT 14-3879]|uniref:AAA family ATPase n=1 Tax=Helicobacter sp. MIT 14-3879 TaxID=2040649 RepID=UPI000E1E8099|nr:AAA family ATPase [Helicobacter sp. MIT 14-3879]RDU65514.1 ATP-dependent Clp protease ATP-binding subunit ClpA [Helicobacter sp. MIT 14-3879]
MLDKNLNLIIQEALDTANMLKHDMITIEHIFLALLNNNDGVKFLTEVGANIDELKSQVTHYLKTFLEPSFEATKPVYTTALENVFGIMINLADNAKKEYIDIYDLLVAIMSDENSYSTLLLKSQNISKLDILEVLVDKKDNKQDKKENKSELDLYTRELVKLAKDGLIDPVIGRDNEVSRVIEILSRRKKNNPLLIGEPGVGKTAIAEGIALKIANNDIIDSLKNCKIYALDLGLLIAGTKYRGDFEKRMKIILDLVKKDRNAIIFIDEIHTIVGAGSSNGGSLDASNLLKPALANGTFRCIGATTYSEFRNHFDKDKALSRRFGTINIDEPSIDVSIEILHSLAPIYEKFHNVVYSKDAIESCVILSKRFINDRFLPDKAIDLLDEAGAYYKIYTKSINKTKKIHINRSDIEYLMTKNTKIPIIKNNNDGILLKNLVKKLKTRIFGQDKAIENLYKSLLKNKAGLGNPNKPIGVFLFTGPTGVGKSELAKELSINLNISLKRFDMSEYSEPHSVSKFIGAPAGYVGFDQGGLLVEAIRKDPYCVLLLDEIEKAHSSIYNLLLQVFDNASLVDNSGNKADFKNVVIIMTSNVGQDELPALGFNNNAPKDRALKDLFSPELRNRLDSIIHFNSLSKSHLKLILQKQINDLNMNLKNIKLLLMPSAYEYLLSLDYDNSLGAREIERIVDNEIKIPLSEILLFNKFKKDTIIRVTSLNNKLEFKNIIKSKDEVRLK